MQLLDILAFFALSKFAEPVSELRTHDVATLAVKRLLVDGLELRGLGTHEHVLCQQVLWH
jgi:hypothetical protein